MDKHYRDAADWTGIPMVSANVGARPRKHPFNVDGKIFVTEGEYRLALMLKAMGIANTPNVRIPVPRNGKDRTFIPDVTLDRVPYLWTATTPNFVRKRTPYKPEDWSGGPILIHGFEAKSTNIPSETRSHIKHARRLYGVIYIILTKDEIDHYFLSGKGLPLLPLP